MDEEYVFLQQSFHPSFDTVPVHGECLPLYVYILPFNLWISVADFFLKRSHVYVISRFMHGLVPCSETYHVP